MNNRFGRFILDSLLLALLFGLLVLPFSSIGLFGYRPVNEAGVAVLGETTDSPRNEFDKRTVPPIVKENTITPAPSPEVIAIEELEDDDQSSESEEILEEGIAN